MLKAKTTTKLLTAVALLFAWSNIGASGCNITLPWDPGTTSPLCSTMGQGGAGGDNGAGGGAGGDDGVAGAPGAGVGGAPGSGAGAGAGSGNVSSAAVSAGAGPGDGAGAGPGMRTAGGRPRHVRPHHKEHIGTAAQADCPEPAVPLMMIPKPPVMVGLTTTKLRAIAAYLKMGAGLTGVQLNREIGIRFENWVLFMLNLTPWTKLLFSLERQAQNGGLPASVVPDALTDLKLFSTETGFTPFPLSELWEVKAVAGTLTLSTRQGQILGLLDVARQSAAGTSTLPKHPPPVLVFTTTSNTMIGLDVLARATQWGVAVWQETVAYDATDPNDPNPDLCIMEVGPMNQNVYPPGGLPLPFQINGACSKLNSPTTTPVVVPNNPDPPEVDG